MHRTKKQKISYFWEVRNLSFGRIWTHFGRPKVMTNLVFSQHEQPPNRKVYAANLNIVGGQKPLKMVSKKLDNYRKTT